MSSAPERWKKMPKEVCRMWSKGRCWSLPEWFQWLDRTRGQMGMGRGVGGEEMETE